MIVSKTFDVGDVQYEVEARIVSRGSPPSYDDPGDGGEVDVLPHVDVMISPECSDVLHVETFYLYLAHARGITLDEAREMTELALLERAQEWVEDD